MTRKTLINLKLRLKDVKPRSTEHSMLEALSKKAKYKNFEDFRNQYGMEELTVEIAIISLLAQC